MNVISEILSTYIRVEKKRLANNCVRDHETKENEDTVKFQNDSD